MYLDKQEEVDKRSNETKRGWKNEAKEIEETLCFSVVFQPADITNDDSSINGLCSVSWKASRGIDHSRIVSTVYTHRLMVLESSPSVAFQMLHLYSSMRTKSSARLKRLTAAFHRFSIHPNLSFTFRITTAMLSIRLCNASRGIYANIVSMKNACKVFPFPCKQSL